MSKQQIVAFTQKHKGSILAYSLIILSMMMLIVVSISTSSIIEKKAASGTEFSMQALQTADSGTQLALKAIKANSGPAKTLDDLATTLAGATSACSSGKITVNNTAGPTGSSFELTFFNTAAAASADKISSCGGLVNTIKNIKSVGTYKGTARAVSVTVSGGDDCGASTACPGSCTFGGLTYGIVEGLDNRCWMDRNLGAKSYPYVITSKTDQNGYGWLFQWGRKSDGHQYTAWGGQTSPSLSSTTGMISSFSIVSPPNTSKFIIDPSSIEMDWLNPQITSPPSNLWDGTRDNNPCPAGFHVPSQTEWGFVINTLPLFTCSSNCDDLAFSSWLKLTLAGARDRLGSVFDKDVKGFYWSDSIGGSGSFSRRVYFTSSIFWVENSPRVQGASVRCIKDQF